MVDPDLWVLFQVLVALFIPSARVDSDGKAEATSRRLSLRAVIKIKNIILFRLVGRDLIENKLLLYRQEQATTKPRSDAVPTALKIPKV